MIFNDPFSCNCRSYTLRPRLGLKCCAVGVETNWLNWFGCYISEFLVSLKKICGHFSKFVKSERACVWWWQVTGDVFRVRPISENSRVVVPSKNELTGRTHIVWTHPRYPRHFRSTEKKKNCRVVASTLSPKRILTSAVLFSLFLSTTAFAIRDSETFIEAPYSRHGVPFFHFLHLLDFLRKHSGFNETLFT